jgi:hypothetical protein
VRFLLNYLIQLKIDATVMWCKFRNNTLVRHARRVWHNAAQNQFFLGIVSNKVGGVFIVVILITVVIGWHDTVSCHCTDSRHALLTTCHPNTAL